MESQRTDPDIISCIRLVLDTSNHSSFYDAMSMTTTNALVLRAAREQDSIGDVIFLFGRFSSVWKEMQRAYLLRTYPTKNYSADAWVKRFIARIYRTVKGIWKFRCDHVHGIELAMTSKREKKRFT